MLLENLRDANCFRDNAVAPAPNPLQERAVGMEREKPMSGGKSEANSATNNYLDSRTPKRVWEEPKPSNTKAAVPDREKLLLAKGFEESPYIIPGRRVLMFAS